jgi:hypothetical protein
MKKQKYDWDAIAQDYQNGVQSKDICKKYQLTSVQLKNFIFRSQVKRPKNFKINKALNVNKIADKIQSLVDKKIPQKKIQEHLNLTKSTFGKIVKKHQIKSKISVLNRKKLTNFQAEEIRNKYYLGLWAKKTALELFEYLKNINFIDICFSGFKNILYYKSYIDYLNLTPEQIKALHQEMKRKRQELIDDLN